jgi:NAD(P) transhydrogenase subunit alpha
VVETGAGAGAHYPDGAYAEAGAQIVDSAQALGADIVLKVRAPNIQERSHMKAGAVLVGMLDPFDLAGINDLAGAGLTAFALEAAPRITRAQSLDVLSSQANLAGYKAVLLAADHYGRMIPMMMTAAGTLKAARVVILGAGVAGLQAIATAKRLGAVVEASDVRPAAKEQIESLGAKFIDVPFETDEEREIAQGVGGYARPMPASWMARQATLVAERCRQADIVISTALIPGRPAPVLISAETVQAMKPGSVIVDLAVERGGNCPLSEKDAIVEKHGVCPQCPRLHEVNHRCRWPASHQARRRNHYCLLDVHGRKSLKERLMEAVSPTLINFIIFVLAIYVGFHVVWNVTPALHTPLMAVTNAISAIVIVGAMLAAALTESSLARYMGVFAVALAAVNVFGGFLVTRRMLEMFKKKDKKPSSGGAA